MEKRVGVWQQICLEDGDGYGMFLYSEKCLGLRKKLLSSKKKLAERIAIMMRDKKKKQCRCCPYALGSIKTLVCPCTECERYWDKPLFQKSVQKTIYQKETTIDEKIPPGKE